MNKDNMPANKIKLDGSKEIKQMPEVIKQPPENRVK